MQFKMSPVQPEGFPVDCLWNEPCVLCAEPHLFFFVLLYSPLCFPCISPSFPHFFSMALDAQSKDAGIRTLVMLDEQGGKCGCILDDNISCILGT